SHHVVLPLVAANHRPATAGPAPPPSRRSGARCWPRGVAEPTGPSPGHLGSARRPPARQTDLAQRARHPRRDQGPATGSPRTDGPHQSGSADAPALRATFDSGGGSGAGHRGRGGEETTHPCAEKAEGNPHVPPRGTRSVQPMSSESSTPELLEQLV